MVEFTAASVDVSEEDDLLTVQFSGRRKYLQFVRDLEPDSVNPTYYIEVNDQGGGGYGWADRVELHPDRISVVQAKPERMPELGWPYGYAWALGLMVMVGAILTLIFKRIDWL